MISRESSDRQSEGWRSGRLGLDHDQVHFGRFGVPVIVRYLDRRDGAMNEKERDKPLTASRRATWDVVVPKSAGIHKESFRQPRTLGTDASQY